MKTSTLLKDMRPEEKYQRVLVQREIDAVKFSSQYRHLFKSVDCPACRMKGEHTFQKYGFAHERCPQCQTLFCSPRPGDELLMKYYADFDAPKMWTDLVLTSESKRKKRQYGPRVEALIGHIQTSGRTRGGRVLDLGAGEGTFSVCMQESGFFDETICLDYSPKAVEACRSKGLEARIGDLASEKDETYDLVCMNDLFEHVSDPLGMLETCRRKLRNGGMLSIATPNGNGFDFQILGENTENITPPEHLNYFNPASMSLLMKRAGFRPVVIETPGKLDVEIIRNKIASGLNLSDGNRFLDYLYRQGDSVLENFQNFLAVNCLSSHMLCLAETSK